MCEHLHYFEAADGVTVVALPFALDDMLAQWGTLRRHMIRHRNSTFTREEWAYLITFLDPDHLRAAFTTTFGSAVDGMRGRVTHLARPRGPIALWLPNNVSLLGPLTLILLTLTGNQIRVKGGSHSEDMVSAFLSYVQDILPGATLADYLQRTVQHAVFDRQDPRNVEMAGESRMRIVFGSDEAARSVHALPHPLDSVGFSFSDRRSEVWLEADALTDDSLLSLIKVFVIYGQAGCTSPGRVVLLDRPRTEAVVLRDRLLELWPKAALRAAAPHLASGNVMARQWAAAVGWDAQLASSNQAVLAVGDGELPPIPSLLFLPIVAQPLAEAMERLPHNIQTVGHAVTEPTSARWVNVLARTRIKRFVPIERMHHFGVDWDGESYWRQAFEMIELGAKQ